MEINKVMVVEEILDVDNNYGQIWIKITQFISFWQKLFLLENSFRFGISNIEIFGILIDF